VPTGILKKPSDIKLPIAAAEGEVDDYVKTLHPELQKFAKSLLIAALGHYGPMFWKKIKHNDNKSNPSLPSVLRNLLRFNFKHYLRLRRVRSSKLSALR